MKLTFELRLVDEYGTVHGVACRELPREAAYIGNRAVEETRMGLGPLSPGEPLGGMVKMMKAREFRRELLVDAAKGAAHQLSDFLSDREGWHGLDRQESAERYLKGRYD